MVNQFLAIKRKIDVFAEKLGKLKIIIEHEPVYFQKEKITDDFYFWFLDFIQMYEVIHVNIARNRSKLDQGEDQGTLRKVSMEQLWVGICSLILMLKGNYKEGSAVKHTSAFQKTRV